MTDKRKAATLTPKQTRFVEEYLRDLNATQAAIRAGYKPDRAQQMGSENLSKPVVAAAIQAEMDARSKRTQVTADRVLQEIAKIAFADIRKAVSFGPDGVSIRPSEEIDDDTAAAISEVSETTTKDGGSKRVKLCSKEKALELAARHLGMLNDRLAVDNKVTINLAERMKEVIARGNRNSD